ncbi:hypothetical protein NP233_g5992 [Leucocoprinus birnbaumii]|uniref:Uncharacterized protein n=1 Tax=Leucocoprinus birnbaumii TaxID=56174 RepID=A0AAD5VRT8_9AGAR|nr:hypothetical protein NP233_g5992 [Leucocoprinus birnbaumii]
MTHLRVRHWAHSSLVDANAETSNVSEVSLETRTDNWPIRTGIASLNKKRKDYEQRTSASGAKSRSGLPGHRTVNNIEVSAIQQAEDLRQLAETTECANLIELSMLDFGDYDGDASYFTHLFDDITLPVAEPEPVDPDVVSDNDTQSDQDKALEPTGIRLDVRDQKALESLRVDPPMSTADKVTEWFAKFEDEPFPSEGDFYNPKGVGAHKFHYSKVDAHAHKYMDQLMDKQRDEIGLGTNLEYFNDPTLANVENILNMRHSHHIFECPDDFIHVVEPLHFSVHWNLLNEKFNVVNWVEKQHYKLTQRSIPKPENIMKDIRTLFDTSRNPHSAATEVHESLDMMGIDLEAYGQQVEAGMYPSIQRNSTIPRDISRVIPRPIVVVVKVNGHPCCALIDTGSMGDFISTTIAQQLNVPKFELIKAIPKLNYESEFDVMNLANYDIVLGTPFLYQHKVSICMEPPAVVIDSKESIPLKGPRIAKMSSRVMTTYEDKLEEVKSGLFNYAKKVCRNGLETPLPPLREINHEIPLINPDAKYSWHPSCCPDALHQHFVTRLLCLIKNYLIRAFCNIFNLHNPKISIEPYAIH